MGNINTQYTHFSSLGRDQLAGPRSTAVLPQDTQKALNDARNTTTRILATGVAGEGAQEATSILANADKISRLSQGDINAVNLKAAVDVGAKFTQGEVQELLGTVATPLSAVVSVESLGRTIDTTLKDPNADNVKVLVKTTQSATTAFSQLSSLIVNYGDDAINVLANNSSTISSLMAKGLSSQTAGVVRTGLETSGKVLGRISTGLNIGVAALDVVIAGRDIKNFWEDPTGKSFTKMGLGLVAAGASILAAAKLPGLSTKASMVAALADIGKVGVDVNWGGVYQGAKTGVTSFASDKYQAFKSEVISSRLPVGATVAPVSATVAPVGGPESPVLPLLRSGVIGASLKAA